MPVFLFPDTSNFPDVELSNEDGLLAFGGNLEVPTLLNAYRNGIFPWYNENEPICWYSPDPRFILFPENIRISKSMQAVIRKNEFTFSVDKNFEGVVRGCRYSKRKYGQGTWISDEIEIAYTNLFRNGYAHSAETWYEEELAGGLYGVQLGKVFFGESMFADKTNASKFAFIKFAEVLKKRGVRLIDCQVYTPHLESLGAEFIRRKRFVELLGKLIT
ncbi:MAG TPA: leucyl/phenylalanyl-tRNA--protein transferase [Chitinophagaceae bacterium]|nr:leucyl/phenylalanyl-tRNA--protein transferase [Chitinophagaceae bacterium]